MRRIGIFAFLAILVWCAIGTLIYPEWWYRLVFERQYLELNYWGSGNYFAFLHSFNYIFPIALTVWAILSLIHTKIPEKLAIFNSKLWTSIVTSKGFSYTSVGLIAIFLIGFFTSGLRSKDSRDLTDRLAKSQQELQVTLDKLRAPSEGPPLSDPTSFAYIDTQEVDSLYGQNEPDLVPALVRKKIEQSSHFDAGAKVEDFLKTDAGRSQVVAEETELRRTEKNPQRKLQDLIGFLNGQEKLKRYGHQRWKSDELQKLEDATSLLSKYGVIADPKKLQAVRDRLLYEEVQRIENELSVLHGLVLVDGDWTVEKAQDAYRFRAPAVQQISKPLFFEIRIRSDDLNSKTRDIIEALKVRPIRLTVFGNVIAGASPGERSVHIMPIAVF